MTIENYKLKKKIEKYICDSFPPMENKVFWNDKEQIRNHIAEVINRKTNIVYDYDMKFNEVTGDVQLTVFSPTFIWKEDDEETNNSG